MSKPPTFSSALLAWFDQHGRHNLPWQHPRSAYAVWLSEVMLQQTQVVTVIPYFLRFITAFPTVQALAAAPSDEVMRLWAGLGYYARARNLHAAAQAVVADYGGVFPPSAALLQTLPGIGPSTAGAIAAQAYGLPEAILDGNVKRVLSRWAGISGYPGSPAVERTLWALSRSLLPATRLADYTQALMDFGATLCTAKAPACLHCPLPNCQALSSGQVALLPIPKPSKARPTRSAWLLIAQNELGEWLMEQRPPAGIWGGLWCPPVIEGDWPSPLAERHGLALHQPQPGSLISHAFTHYQLLLTPLVGRAQWLGNSVQETPSRWLSPQALRRGEFALPSPITKYLNSSPATCTGAK